LSHRGRGRGERCLESPPAPVDEPTVGPTAPSDLSQKGQGPRGIEGVLRQSVPNRIVLVASAKDRDAVLELFKDDPWYADDVLRLASVHAWEWHLAAA